MTDIYTISTAPPTKKQTVLRRFSVAPMLDWTDRHERFFLRLLSRHAVLYTEMVTTGALLHGDVDRHLAYHDSEHPVALQLGGSDADELARCAELAQRYGYDEINLNVGCPSDRVQSGSFGACLMNTPDVVAAGVVAMQRHCDLPVTVKSRIGIDDLDNDEFLQRFIETVAQAGCQTFILHARIAILQGLSPKENREIPPLQYDRVYRMKSRYPQLEIIINGGIRTLEQCQDCLTHVDGVMVGREVYQNPWFLSHIDRAIFNDDLPPLTRHQVIRRLLPYVEEQIDRGVGLHHMTRHILGLYKGQPGGRLFRRHLSENAWRPGATVNILTEAVELAEEATARVAEYHDRVITTPETDATC